MIQKTDIKGFCKPQFDGTRTVQTSLRFVDKNGHAIEINYGLFFFGLMPKKTYDLMCSSSMSDS